MNPGLTTSITYEKDSGEVSEREIIAIDVPRDVVKALDVTNEDPEIRHELEDLVEEYLEYKKQQIQNIFTFENWLAHISRDEYQLKWRTFKLSGITEH